MRATRNTARSQSICASRPSRRASESDVSTTPESGREPTAPPPSERATMVSWFDPAQLARTGLQTVISTMFGRSADRRLLDAVSHPLVAACHDAESDELW